MGPSGAGKTTFLNVLSGKVEKTNGTLLINGKSEEMHVYRKLVGFVPQEDVMLRMLTVKEILTFQAHLRLPNDHPDKSKVVNKVIEFLVSNIYIYKIGRYTDKEIDR